MRSARRNQPRWRSEALAVNAIPLASMTQALPEIVLTCGAMALLMLGAYSERTEKAVSLCSILLLIAAAAIVAVIPNGRIFGTSFIVDDFARFMKILAYAGSAFAIVMSFGLMLGFILLIVPGFILFAMWFVATPPCVVEQLGPFRSLGRSAQLTKGHRWKVFGLFIVLMLISAVIGGGVSMMLRQLGSPVLTAIGNLLWNGVWGALYSIAVVVTYHDLRVAKEGVDIEHIASVFD
jgi:uncharacterized membrane protein